MRNAHPRAIVMACALFTATLACAPSALAAGVAPSQATPVQREQAQSRFLRGKEKLAKRKPTEAIVEFRASLDIVASPNTRLYVARCLRESGQIVAAYVELGRTEVEAKELSRDDPRYERAGQAAREERASLEPQLGFLNVDVTHSESSTTLKVAGEAVRPGGWSEPIPVLPGSAEVVVETADRPPIRRTVTIAARERQSVAIDAAEGAPPPPEVVAASARMVPYPPRNRTRTMAYVAGGVAVVGLGVFTIFGLQANGTYSDLEKACNGPCPPGREGQIAEGRTQQTVANVGLAVFVVGAAAGVTLWVLSKPSSSSASGAHASLGFGSVSLRGTF